MTRSTLAVLAAALALAACGPGNTEITVAGHTLKPQGADFFSGPISSEIPIPISLVMVTDVKDSCDQWAKVASATDSCTGSSSSGLPNVAGNYLMIAVIGASEGDFTVGGNGGFSSAGVQFVSVEAGKAAFTDEGVSGKVTFDKLKPDSEAYGSYDVTLKSGAHITGSFQGKACAGLGNLFKLSGSDRTCTQSSSQTSCNRSCNCGASGSATVSCTRNDAMSDWTCNCDNRGQKSTCTMTKDHSFDACEQGTTCCGF